jgi:hypothetical protein
LWPFHAFTWQSREQYLAVLSRITWSKLQYLRENRTTYLQPEQYFIESPARAEQLWQTL